MAMEENLWFLRGVNKFSLESKNLSVRYDRTEPKTIADRQ
jgi:hypothetical protein